MQVNCSKCGGEFTAAKRWPKSRRCYPCDLEARRLWYERGGREKVRETARRYRERTGYRGCWDRDKAHSRNLTQAAIRRGILVRQPCEACGNPKSESHHDDYGQPLQVRWLCGPCHRSHHLAIRARGKA